LNWSVFAISFAVLAAGRPEEVWSIRRMIHGRLRATATLNSKMSGRE
jgi:hypothetical protein